MIVLHICDSNEPKALEVNWNPVVFHEGVSIEVAQIEGSGNADNCDSSTDYTLDTFLLGLEDSGVGPEVRAVG
jgi:hypothetical protein